MKKWKKWKSSNINQNYDAIIIGSGISGLTTGVFLSKNNINYAYRNKFIRFT